MIKSELVKVMAEKSSLTIKDSGKFLDAFITVTEESLSKGEDVVLVGFGTFSRIERKGRIARNFKTKAIIKVPPSKSVKFKAGKNLRAVVN
jgi:DNA-binding protein HU-beta